MKLIDEKGRLFGKINLFDLLVVLLVLVGVIGMGTRLIKTNRETAEMTTANFQLEIVGAQECFKTAYNVGDSLYEADTLLGTITAVEVAPSESLKMMPDGTAKMVESVLYYDVTLTLTTDRFSTDSGYSVDSAEWLAGTSHIVSNGYAVSTVVVRSVEIAE